MVLVPGLEIGGGHSCVSFNYWGVLFSGHCGLVDHIFTFAGAIFWARAIVLIATVAGGVSFLWI